jgi:DNA replication protein DnaC
MTTEKETLICDIHGPYSLQAFGGRRCPTCDEEHWKEQERQRAAEDALARLKAARIPILFRGKLLNDFEADTPAQQKVLRVAKEYVDRFSEHLTCGRGLIMLGNVGTGKTMLSCAIAQAVNTEHSHDRPFLALYATASEIIRTVRDTWGSREENTTDAITRFVTPNLLIIDEIGANVGTDSERALLFEVIDLRYGATRPTIAVTNCDPSGLTAVLGERAVDRLRDHDADVCVFDWESKRRWKGVNGL